MKNSKLSAVLLTLALLFGAVGVIQIASYALEGDYVRVTNIIDVPEMTLPGKSLELTGTVLPYNATNQNIIWSVKNAGITGATISGSIFKATSEGTAVVTAMVPYGADNDWAAVSAKLSHAVALKKDGSLAAWGWNLYGQVGDGTNINRDTPVWIGSDNDWVDVSANGGHTVALKENGSLWAWGRNEYGQIGDGTNTDRNTPRRIGADNDWAAISAGNQHTVALKTDGSLWAWGRNTYGQIGDGTNWERNTPRRIGVDNDWALISTGSQHTFALKTDGSLWAWGRNANGQLGDGTIIDRNLPVRIGEDNDWSAIPASSSSTTMALKTDGSLWAWGWNANGTLGDGTNIDRNLPRRIGADNDWAVVSAGYYHTIALKTDGTLWAWGNNAYGQFGNGITGTSNAPVQVGADNDWAAVSAGEVQTVALKEDGTLWSWGRNTNGQLGTGANTGHSIPGKVLPMAAYMKEYVIKVSRAAAINPGGDYIPVTDIIGAPETAMAETPLEFTAAVFPYDATNQNIVWSVKDAGTTGATINGNVFNAREVGTAVVTASITGVDISFKAVSAGGGHTVALKEDGTLWGWGDNGCGQLGDGYNRRLIPVQIGNDSDWAAISAGSDYTVALKTDGTIWNLGGKDHRQGPGWGAVGCDYRHEQIGWDNDWAAISAGDVHTVALKTDGSLWAWGANYYGQLGNGDNTEDYTSLQQIGWDYDWSAISAGGNYTLALKTDGSLWAWGRNEHGQLGDGTNDDRNIPVQIVHVSAWDDNYNWQEISAGGEHAIALKTDGSLWAWGENWNGSLGDGTNSNSNIPLQIGDKPYWWGEHWTAISAGGGYTLALKEDGSLWAWGNNNYGQLGDGTDINRNSPVQIGHVSSWEYNYNWQAISAGREHAAALKNDGSIWVWGHNEYGQLGDGSDPGYWYNVCRFPVKITLPEYTQDFVITVSLNPLLINRIVVTAPPLSTVYTVGGILDLSGMVVTAVYNNGDSKEVTNDTRTSPADGYVFNYAGQQNVWVYYTENGISRNTSFQITVLGLSELGSITVTVPDADVYNNYTVRLTAPAYSYSANLSGSSIVFSALVRDALYRAELLSPIGALFGVIENIDISQDANAVVSFSGLPVPQTLTVTVTGQSGGVFADGYEIFWYEEDSTESFATGTNLAGLAGGSTLRYEIVKYNELSEQYDVLAQGSVTVSETGGNAINVSLLPLTITGRVISGGAPVAGATVTVVSMLDSAEPYESTAVTGAEGFFETAAYAGSIKIFTTKTGFADSERSLNVTASGNIGDITLEKTEGLVVALNMTYTEAAVQGDTPLTTNLTSARNLLFTLRNVTKGRDITEFVLSGLTIVIEDDTVAPGDEILASAVDISGNMADANSAFIAGSGDAYLSFIQKGLWKAQIAPEKASMALLYDSAGQYIDTFYGNTEFTGNVLPEGSYSLVFINFSNLMRSIGNISDFDMLGLVDGTDYAMRMFGVTRGIIADLGTVHVPELDESKLFRTDPKRTSVVLGRSAAVAGTPVAVRAEYGFIEEHINGVSGITLIVPTPEGCEVVPNSFTLDGKPAQYDITASGIEVHASGAGGILHFYVVPVEAGNHAVAVFTRFSYEGNAVTQPVGTAALRVETLKINVQDKTGGKMVTANGIAEPGSTVTVFNNDKAVGTTSANAVGSWQLQFELTDTDEVSLHEIYADVTTQVSQKPVRSESRELSYDETTPVATRVTISNYSHQGGSGRIVLDSQNWWGFANYDTLHYTYDPSYPVFTFEVEFAQPDLVKLLGVGVVVVTTGRDGIPVYVGTKYDSVKNIWVGTHAYMSHNAPEWVSVAYAVHQDDLPGTITPKDDPPGTITPRVHLIPKWDPSGYVYEAVESNRVEGVTATAYFSEYEDGRDSVIWNAGDYDQGNPLITDAGGRYAWDVPFGWWQVKFEKDGYETAWSEWVPVPPVQTEVNVGMVSLATPIVSSVSGYENYIEIAFDRYMDTASLTNDSVTITNGYSGGYFISYVDAEPDPYPTPENAGKLFAGIARVVPQNGRFEMGGVVGVCVDSGARSYAGIALQNTCQNVEITYEPLGLSVEDEINVNYGESRIIEVAVFPAEAGAYKKITAVSTSPFIAAVDAEAVTDGSGMALFTITGELSGSAEIIFMLENTQIANTTTVNVGLPGETVSSFVAVTDIIGVPETATAGTPLTLTGSVIPSDATNRVITWSVKNAGTTGTTIAGGTLNATAAGIVVVTATVADGLGAGINYARDFIITVNPAQEPPAEPILKITDIVMVGRTRVGLSTTYDFTFRMEVTNQGSATADDVTAVLAETQSGVTAIDGDLIFGDISAGAAANDTFTIRVPGSVDFEESLQVFNFYCGGVQCAVTP